MTQSTQEQFEAEYAAHTFRMLDLIKMYRLSNGSYSDPCVAKAWHWFKRSREMLVVDLPPEPQVPDEPEEAIDDSHMDGYHAAIRMRSACLKAVDAAGITIAKVPRP